MWNYEKEVVELIEAFELNKLLKYKESLGIKIPRDLNSKIKMKSIMTSRGLKEHGRRLVFTHLKVKPHLLENDYEGAKASQR
jgi:hypothetical protein